MVADIEKRRTFLANIRHELHTPLNAIIGYSDMLLEDCQGDDSLQIASQLQEILNAGNRLLAIVHNVLVPRKIAADSIVDLNEYNQKIATEVATPLQTILTHSQELLKVCLQAEQNSWADDLERIQTAASQVYQLLQEIEQTVSSYYNEEDEALALETLEGVQATVARDVFKTLKRLRVDAAAQRPLTGHILVVDDNAENRDILFRRLTKQGHHVTLFEDGLSVLEYLSHETNLATVDLMLLDVLMPEMNGFELLARLKNDPLLRHLPVIFLSALDDMESLFRGIEMGAQDFLPKPFNPVLLKARIEAILEKKKLRDLELEYVENMIKITAAAAAFEAGEFTPDILNNVSQRTDELGRLARVLQNMAYEVRAREERLKQEVYQLRIEIDSNKEATKVAEIIESEYFQKLQQRANQFRESFDVE